MKENKEKEKTGEREEMWNRSFGQEKNQEMMKKGKNIKGEGKKGGWGRSTMESYQWRI